MQRAVLARLRALLSLLSTFPSHLPGFPWRCPLSSCPALLLLLPTPLLRVTLHAASEHECRHAHAWSARSSCWPRGRSVRVSGRAGRPELRVLGGRGALRRGGRSVRSEAGGQRSASLHLESLQLFLAATPTLATSPGLFSEPVTACGLLSLLPATARPPGQSGALYEILKSCHVFFSTCFSTSPLAFNITELRPVTWPQI